MENPELLELRRLEINLKLSENEIKRKEILIGLFKHLGTLSFAAILLILGFLKFLADFDGNRPTPTITIVCFIVCLMGSVVYSFLLQADIESNESEAFIRRHNIRVAIATLTTICFFSGIVGIVFLVLTNI